MDRSVFLENRSEIGTNGTGTASRARKEIGTSFRSDFRSVSALGSFRFRCGACFRMTDQAGSGVRTVLGMRAKVCARCKLPSRARFDRRES